MTPKAFLPAILALVAAGCSEIGYYPICVVDSGEIAPELVWLRSKEGVRASLVQSTGSAGSYSEITSSGVVVSASAETHRALVALWPNVACVGETASLAGEELVRQCQANMKTFFSEHLSIWPGPKSQIASTCVRIEPGKGR
jgi:hypothetical protein